MKRNSRKGFTIVELVIVIAIIAILAAVLIPTFAGIIGKANEAAALSEARTIMTEYIASFDYSNDENMPAAEYYIRVDSYVFKVTNGELEPTSINGSIPAGATVVTADDTVSVGSDESNSPVYDADEWPDISTASGT